MDLATAQSMKDSADKLTDLVGGGISADEHKQVSSEMAKVFEQAMLPDSDLSKAELKELNKAYDDVMKTFSCSDDKYAKSVGDFAKTLEKITADDLPKCEEDKGLKVDGDKIDTGRYEITCDEGSVKIYDKETKTWVKAHGDPHLTTGDGDHAQFHDQPLTIDLKDGTKVTIQPTGKDENGISLIDKVAITKGDEAVVVSGFNDGKDGVSNTGVMDGEGVADGVDKSFKDGTVLEAGDQVDDLSFTDKDGKATEELKGRDETQKWGEHMLDGRGGASNLGAEGAGESGESGGPKETGEKPNSELFLEAAKNADDPAEKATHLRSALAELKDELAAEGGAKSEDKKGSEEAGGAEKSEEAGGAGGAEGSEIPKEVLQQIVELLDQLVQLIEGSQMPDAAKDKMLDQIIGIMESLGLSGGVQKQGE